MGSEQGRRMAAVAGLVALILLGGLAFLLGRVAGGQRPSTSATAGPAVQATATATPAPAAAGQTPGDSTQPPPQRILAFSVPPAFQCPAAPALLHVSWRTANATGVAISIDGAGTFREYPATGAADVPFACGNSQNTYLLTTRGPGTPATRSAVVKRLLRPTPS